MGVLHRHDVAGAAAARKHSLCQLAGHSSLAVTEKYYVHVTAPHVASGFERFVQYSERGTARGIRDALPDASEAVQGIHVYHHVYHRKRFLELKSANGQNRGIGGPAANPLISQLLVVKSESVALSSRG